MSTPEVTVGIDIGTTSVKAVAADEGGQILARTRVKHEPQSPEPGTLQHDVNKAWRRNVGRAWRTVAEGHRVLGVQVSGAVPTLTAVNGRGAALAPGLLYGDKRGGARVGKSPAENGEFLGFLRWLALEAPGAYGYWPAQAVANHSLCGVGAIDSTTAMTALPAFNYVGWDEEVLADLSLLPGQLPMVSSGPEAIGTVDGGAVIGGGIIDALAEQWVAGADQVGDVLVICGASLLTWTVIDEWRQPEGLWSVPHTVPGLTLVGGASNAGGIFVEWAKRVLRFDLGEGLVSDPHSIPIWAPYPKGERTPIHAPNRLATLTDLAISNGPADLRRSVFEASGFVVRHHLDLVDVDAKRIVCTGGGTRSDEWMQCLADCTGLPVHVAAVAEGAALGAAFLARVTAGLEAVPEDGRRWARTGRIVEPDPAWELAVNERYHRFREIAGPLGP